MKNEAIVAIRKTAELAVADMPSGPLKTSAFQTILSELLQRALGTGKQESKDMRAVPVKRNRVGQGSQGTTGRLVTLIEEGFFANQRSLSEIKQVLSERGWYYRLEDLGTPVTRLVRRRYLRRAQVVEAGKRIWRYSNY